MEFDARYHDGIRHFNERDFYAAHDSWEDLWLETDPGPEKDFLQGLILSAVSLHHYGNRNFGGARSRFHSSLGYFEGIPSPCWGINLTKFIRRMNGALHKLLTSEDPPELDMNIVPLIRVEE